MKHESILKNPLYVITDLTEFNYVIGVATSVESAERIIKQYYDSNNIESDYNLIDEELASTYTVHKDNEEYKVFVRELLADLSYSEQEF